MSLITFKPIEKSVDVPNGTLLLDAARQAGVEFESPCGGKGTCGKCIVRIDTGAVDSESLGQLTKAAVSQGYVLACKTKVLDEPIIVEIPDPIQTLDGKFIEDETVSLLIDKKLLPKKNQLDPLTEKIFLKIPEAQLEDGLSDIDRLRRAIQKNHKINNIEFTLTSIQSVADTLRQDDGNVTVTLSRSSNQYHLIDIETRNTTVHHYGIAVDVGTTTIAIQLVSLSDSKILTTKTAYNDQLTCGLDVISRINYAQKPGNLDELRTRVLNTINRLIQKICKDRTISHHSIYSAVIAGNTTMIHLLLGLKPEYIRLEPYTPTVKEMPLLTAEKTGVEIHPESIIYFSPHVGSYVGGDITSGLLCTEMATNTENVDLFIDIGTNGEIVIGDHEFLMTCACSAGPAFEGGGIEHGMRASLGAIDDVAVDEETGIASYRTIGNVKPKGICGTGMISLLAELFLTGWIDAAGKFNRHKISKAIRVIGRRAEYTIVWEKECGIKKNIIISEIDIENIIRAKAAIYSACSLMIGQLGLTFSDVRKIYIAGGFGQYLNIKHAKTIGLIPDLPDQTFQYIGNASLMGAYMVLISQEYRLRQIELARKITYIELNTDSSYMDQYMGAMFLPHTNKDLFPSIHQKRK